eukprot:gene9071-9241_t
MASDQAKRFANSQKKVAASGLAAIVATVAVTDIDAAISTHPPSLEVKVLSALLQNTLEQTLTAVLAHGAFAVMAPVDWLVLIPAFTLLFIVGRLLFAAGYQYGAGGRALGMALTHVPTTVMMAACCYMLLAGY